MSEIKAIKDNKDESEDETEGADEVSEDEEDHASTIQAEVEPDDSESLDPRIQASILRILEFLRGILLN